MLMMALVVVLCWCCAGIEFGDIGDCRGACGGGDGGGGWCWWLTVVLGLALALLLGLMVAMLVVMVPNGRIRRGLPRDGRGLGGNRRNGLHRQELSRGQDRHRALVQQRHRDHGGQRGVLRGVRRAAG